MAPHARMHGPTPHGCAPLGYPPPMPGPHDAPLPPATWLAGPSSPLPAALIIIASTTSPCLLQTEGGGLTRWWGSMGGAFRAYVAPRARTPS